MAFRREEGTSDCYLQLPEGRTRGRCRQALHGKAKGNRHKLERGKSLLDKRKWFFIMKMVPHWSRSPKV